MALATFEHCRHAISTFTTKELQVLTSSSQTPSYYPFEHLLTNIHLLTQAGDATHINSTNPFGTTITCFTLHQLTQMLAEEGGCNEEVVPVGGYGSSSRGSGYGYGSGYAPTSGHGAWMGGTGGMGFPFGFGSFGSSLMSGMGGGRGCVGTGSTKEVQIHGPVRLGQGHPSSLPRSTHSLLPLPTPPPFFAFSFPKISEYLFFDPFNTPYQHTLKTPYQQTHTHSQHTLSTHLLNTPSTHPINTPYQHTLTSQISMPLCCTSDTNHRQKCDGWQMNLGRNIKLPCCTWMISPTKSGGNASWERMNGWGVMCGKNSIRSVSTSTQYT